MQQGRTNNWTTIDLIKDARNRTFWKTLTIEEREDADLLVKLSAQTQKKNFIPTKDLLQRMWSRMKSTDVITTLTHPKFGSFKTSGDAWIIKSFSRIHTLIKVFQFFNIRFQLFYLSVFGFPSQKCFSENKN